MVDITFIRGNEIKIYTPLFPEIEDQSDIITGVPEGEFTIIYTHNDEVILEATNMSIFLSHVDEPIISYNIIDNPENFIISQLKIEDTEDAEIVYLTLLSLENYDFLPNGEIAYAVMCTDKTGNMSLLKAGYFGISEPETIIE